MIPDYAWDDHDFNSITHNARPQSPGITSLLPDCPSTNGPSFLIPSDSSSLITVNVSGRYSLHAFQEGLHQTRLGT